MRGTTKPRRVLAWALVALARHPAVAAAGEGAAPEQAPGVEVRGATDCPTPERVAAELIGLVPQISPRLQPDVAELRPGVDGGVLVRLTRGSGKLVGERTVPSGPDCGESARGLAVVIASWETALPASTQLALAPAAAAPRSPLAPGEASPAFGGAAEPRPAARVVFGVAALYSIDDEGASPGAALELSRELGDGAAFVRVGIVYCGAGETTLSPGSVSWWRVGGIAGGGVTLGAARWSLELGAAAAAAVLHLDASGFPSQRGDSALDPGAFGWLRVRMRGDAVSPWTGATGVWWSRRHEAYIDGLVGHVEVPAVQLLLMAGLDFSVR